MASNEQMQCVSLEAAADLSALQFTCVKAATPSKCDSAVAATTPLLGILQNKPIAGQPAEVCVGGICKAKVGSGGWTAGAKLTATTGGVLIATTTEPNHYVGIALADAAQNDYAPLMVQPGMVSAA